MGNSIKWLAGVAILAAVAGMSAILAGLAPGELPAAADVSSLPSDAEIVVYKTPTCGCCEGWIAHMRSSGYEVASIDLDLAGVMAKKRQLGVPAKAASCHTAVIDGQVVEGHVPAEVIRQLQRDRPEAIGLAAPGMPAGSPGMGGRLGDGYDVFLLEASGEVTVFTRVATHR